MRKTFNSFWDLLGPEDHLHIQVCNYLKAQYPKVVWLHVPNEGKRSKFERWKFKVLGAKAGFPDIAIFTGHGNLVIELKIKPNNPNPNQIAWLLALESLGWETVVCYTFEEAKEVIDGFLRK